MRFFRTSLACTFAILSTTTSVMAQAAPQSPGGGFTSILPMMLVMFAIIYFLMIRPEQKKQKERQKLLSAVKKGDKVLTNGGMYGTVGSVKDTTVMVKISENTVVEFTKAAIISVINADMEKTADDKEKK